MSPPGSTHLITTHARAHDEALPHTPPLRVAVALTIFLPTDHDVAGPEATAQFAAEESFAVCVAAYEGELHRSWAGHEIHSRHQRLRTPTAEVIAAAEGALIVPRRMCRALGGHEDWAEEPPAGRYYGVAAGENGAVGADGCRPGGLNGWWLHFQAPSTGDVELSAAVVRQRADPEHDEAVQLGSVHVRIILT